MIVNRERALRAVEAAKREFEEGLMRARGGDQAGALKHFQEATEYAAKAVLVAYGVDYPRIHDVGRFLLTIRDRYPAWFSERADEIARITDDLARGRVRYRYPYEFPPEDYEAMAREAGPLVERALKSCQRLLGELFSHG